MKVTEFKFNGETYELLAAYPQSEHIEVECTVLGSEKVHILTIPGNVYVEWYKKNGYHEYSSVSPHPVSGEAVEKDNQEEDGDILLHLNWGQVAEFLNEAADDFMKADTVADFNKLIDDLEVMRTQTSKCSTFSLSHFTLICAAFNILDEVKRQINE